MKSDAPSFNRGFKNGDNPEFGDDNLKGKLFLRQDCSVQSLPILFLYNQKHEASDLGKNASFFFFLLWKRLHFFPLLFQSCCCCSETNPLLLPALVGQRDGSRGWGTNAGFLAFPCSAAMQWKAEMIQRLNTAMKKTSASPACGSSQLQERVNAFLL